MQGQRHPQEQICGSQASCAHTWSLTTLAEGVTLPCPAALGFWGTLMAPALLSPIHSPPSSHKELKHESGPALPGSKPPTAAQSSQGGTHTPRPQAYPGATWATFSPIPTARSLHSSRTGPLGDSPVSGSLSIDRWHSSHHILTSASATRAVGCRRAWRMATGSAHLLEECIMPETVPSLVALAGQKSPSLAAPESVGYNSY